MLSYTYYEGGKETGRQAVHLCESIQTQTYTHSATAAGFKAYTRRERKKSTPLKVYTTQALTVSQLRVGDIYKDGW